MDQQPLARASQVEEDEKENLRKAEERLKVCAAEAAFIAEMGLPQPQAPDQAAPQEPDQAAAAGDADGAEAPPPAEAGAHAAALQERLREAEEKVARLRKLAAGPAIPPVCNTPNREIANTHIPLAAGCGAVAHPAGAQEQAAQSYCGQVKQ